LTVDGPGGLGAGVARDRPLSAGALAQLLDATREIVSGEIGRDVGADDDRRPPRAVRGPKRTRPLDIIRIELQLLDRPPEHPLDRRQIPLCPVAERKRGDRVRSLRPVNTVGELAAGERNILRRPFDVRPRVRLVCVPRVEDLLGGRCGQAWVDALELRERLHRPQRDLANRDLPLKLSGELEDPQVLTNTGLCGLQSLRDALHRPARIQ